MSNIAISVESISKRYKIGRIRGYRTLRDSAADLVLAPIRALRRISGNGDESGENEDFWALRDVSLEIKPGEVVGIIGRNGAGKSTLLKVLCRITRPTSGHAQIRGRVGSLLEVGTGFHPELTGRENVFLNGAILGMRKSDIERRFDEIVAFAEVEKFIDTPVKRYSSGMYVRLAFAVAAHLEPEILIIDEVLAVGDMAFQQKCLGKMSEVRKGGRTVLFVSHNMAAVENLCQSAVLLEQGRVTFRGDTREALDRYVRGLGSGPDAQTHTVDLTNAPGRVRGSRILLKRIDFLDADDRPLVGGVRLGSALRVRIAFELDRPADRVDFGLGFDSATGQRIFTAHSLFEPDWPSTRLAGEQVCVCEFPSVTLVPGEYRLKLALDIAGVETDSIESAAALNVLAADFYETGRQPWNGVFVLKHRWRLGDDTLSALEPVRSSVELR